MLVKIIQQIVGLAIVAVGVKMARDGLGLRLSLAVIVVGFLVALNASRKKKDKEEDEHW